MKDTEYGVKFKIANLGYVDSRVKGSLHAAKSKAGKAFHQPFVQSVCVYDADGEARLYLKRNPDGTYHREER